jgi:protein AroM
MIAFVTIGQSPRDDIVHEIVATMGSRIDYIQLGALDELDSAAISELSPSLGERVMVTRLRTGETVRVSEEKLLPLLQSAVDKATENAQVVFLLCTGSFGQLICAVPLICPERILMQVSLALLPSGSLGILTPDARQLDQQRERWAGAARDMGNQVEVRVVSASPYETSDCSVEGGLVAAAEKLSDCDLIVMDCMGYTLAMKRLMHNRTGKPVVLARSLVGRIAAEIAL